MTYRYDDLDITTVTSTEAARWVEQVRRWAEGEIMQVEKKEG